VFALGQFIAALGMATCGFVYLKSRGLIRFTVSKLDLLAIPRGGFTFAVYAIVFIVVAMVDRFLINHFIGEHGVGIYAVPAAIMAGIMMLIMAVTRAVIPEALRLMSDEREVMQRRRVIYIYAGVWGLAIAAFATAALIGGPVLRFITDVAYHDADVLIVPLAISYMFNTLFVWNATLMMFEKRAHIMVAICIAGAAMNIALGIYIIPAFGLIGAAWVSAAAYAFMALSGFAAMVFYVRLPWRESGLALQSALWQIINKRNG
jgi:O-antigen/teichoic acid export membrane protein